MQHVQVWSSAFEAGYGQKRPEVPLKCSETLMSQLYQYDGHVYTASVRPHYDTEYLCSVVHLMALVCDIPRLPGFKLMCFKQHNCRQEVCDATGCQRELRFDFPIGVIYSICAFKAAKAWRNSHKCSAIEMVFRICPRTLAILRNTECAWCNKSGFSALVVRAVLSLFER